MAARAVTLHLPAPLFERIEQRAQDARRSVEAEILDVVVTSLPASEVLPPHLECAVSALQFLDDADLWQAAQVLLPREDSERMEELHRRNRHSGLDESEAQELARLEREYERVLLVRSHAAALLARRGHDVRPLLSGG